MAAPRIPIIAVCTAAILTLAACASDYRMAELDRIDAMSCPELAAYKAEKAKKLPEMQAVEIAKATAMGGAMLGAMLVVGPLAVLAGPLVTAADVDLGARTNTDLTDARRLEMARCPQNGIMKASTK